MLMAEVWASEGEMLLPWVTDVLLKFIPLSNTAYSLSCMGYIQWKQITFR